MRKTYTYASDGTRLSVETKWNPSPSASAVAGSAVTAANLKSTKKTDYVGNKVYENGTLKRILVDGGYYDMSGKKYYFFVTDHLGSTRIVADADAGGVYQTNQYDPFGLQLAEETVGSQDRQPYKYTAQELDRDQGLNLYDYHARQYDPAIGRFTTMDPLAEKYYSISPYVYCGNNPVRFTDPTGKTIWDFIGGVVHAIGSNLTLGTAPTNTDFVSEPSHYNSGRSVGDMLSIAIGATEMSIGGGMVAGASLATAGSGGAVAPAAVPVAVEGGAVVVHGGTVIGIASKNLFSGNGKIKEFNNSSNSSSSKSNIGENEKNFSNYSDETYKAFEKQLKEHGEKSILKSRNKIERRLTEHENKLQEILKK